MAHPWLSLLLSGVGLGLCSLLFVLLGPAWTAGFGARWGLWIQVALSGGCKLTIAALALAGGLHEVVKASVTGSLLASALLGIGLSAFLGGIRHGNQYFDRERAGMATTLMVLTVIALAIPAIYASLHPGQPRNAGAVESLSLGVAGLMLLFYLLSLYYDRVWRPREEGSGLAGGAPALALLSADEIRARASRPPRGGGRSGAQTVVLGLGALTVTLSLYGVLAWTFVSAVGELLAAGRSSALFLGLIVAPLASNAVEHVAGARAAWRNRMDLALLTATDTCRHVALLGAPLLVFGALMLGQPMDLVFSPFELVAMAAAAIVVNLVAQDGLTNWLEGVMLMGLYAIFGWALFWWSGAF